MVMLKQDNVENIQNENKLGNTSPYFHIYKIYKLLVDHLSQVSR